MIQFELTSKGILCCGVKRPFLIYNLEKYIEAVKLYIREFYTEEFWADKSKANLYDIEYTTTATTVTELPAGLICGCNYFYNFGSYITFYAKNSGEDSPATYLFVECRSTEQHILLPNNFFYSTSTKELLTLNGGDDFSRSYKLFQSLVLPTKNAGVEVNSL